MSGAAPPVDRKRVVVPTGLANISAIKGWLGYRPDAWRFDVAVDGWRNWEAEKPDRLHIVAASAETGTVWHVIFDEDGSTPINQLTGEYTQLETRQGRVEIFCLDDQPF